MNNLPDIAVKELVLIGGGHSHVGLLKMFAMKPMPGLRLTLLASDIHTPYSGMLPGFIAGQYSYDDVHLDLRPLSEFSRCRLYHSKVTHIDTQNQLIFSNNRPPIKYDLLSINIGSTPDDFNIPGVKEFAIPVKPVKQFITHLESTLHRVLTEENFTTIAVVGGGASGVELILSIQHRVQLELARKGLPDKKVEYVLISAAKTLLPSHNNSVKKKILKLFKQRRIKLHLDSFIKDISLEPTANTKNILCSNGTLVQADAIVWSTTASSAEWPGESGLSVDNRGFIKVNDYLQSISHPNIFASGDIASMVNHPRPKSGVYAVRQGPPLFENIRRLVRNERLKAYKPQKHFLSLLNCADKTAVASRGFLAFQGQWVWKYKNWIDVSFMNLFNQLPEMENDSDIDIPHSMVDESALKRLQEIPMRCGGCGAKVGSTILKRVIERLQAVNHAVDQGGASQETEHGVILGLEQADDASVIEIPEGQLLVQSVDYFKSFINDPYLLGKISANHALSDLFAMGATPHSALALVTLPYSVENILEEELFQVMSGALEVLNDNNMSLVGGHTGEGAEMAFGLNVNGFVSKDRLLTKSGLLPSDVLILTKPLGTGTLLAANMRLKAKGRWIDEAIEHMLLSNRAASEVFQNCGVKACTDITGFGLLGHLVEMLKASGVNAQLNLSALPVLSGAHEMIKAGIFSSLQDENIHLKRAISNIETISGHQNYPLLFDPQTSGGLLAGVSRKDAEDCLAKLHSAGFSQAVIIGDVIENDSSDHFVKLS
ncbi:MAG: selenide, water dikinase SelD [Gammaproteobacteria bacterium]|nr:selenide, water dikinase SelD [Gammaproteobacteria bacterium]